MCWERTKGASLEINKLVKAGRVQKVARATYESASGAIASSADASVSRVWVLQSPIKDIVLHKLQIAQGLNQGFQI